VAFFCGHGFLTESCHPTLKLSKTRPINPIRRKSLTNLAGAAVTQQRHVIGITNSSKASMSISSISSSTPVQPPQKAAPVEAAEATRGGKDLKNDGDADDAGAAAQASQPKPVSNTLGQIIGRTVNVTA